MKIRNRGFWLVFLLSALVWNCSSSAIREGETKIDYKTVKFSDSVNVSYSPEAEKEVLRGGYFNTTEFLGYFKNQLSSKGLLLAKAKDIIEIQITDARIRSEGVAIWIGTLAGPDKIKGLVTVKNAKGEIVDKIQVSVAYALGGFAGGLNKNRIGYLYSEFTKLVLEQFGIN